MDESRGLFQRISNLRIGGEVSAAALFAKAAVGNDVPCRAIAEIKGLFRRPLGNPRGNIHSRPRRLAAGDAQRFEETLGDGVGLAAGKPPRAGGTVETL